MKALCLALLLAFSTAHAQLAIPPPHIDARGDLEDEMVQLYHSGHDPAVLAKGSDRHLAGLAEWLLANDTAAGPDFPSQESLCHIVRATWLLASDQPIQSYGENYLYGTADRLRALPYFLLAREYGGEIWVDERIALVEHTTTEIRLAQLKLYDIKQVCQ